MLRAAIAFFVIGLIAPAQVSTPSFHERGIARVLGKHIVLRGVDDTVEQRALEKQLRGLRGEEREESQRQRIRHLFATLLLHEVGHALGAAHTRHLQDVMRWIDSSAVDTFIRLIMQAIEQ